jgi:hypothetical protein
VAKQGFQLNLRWPMRMTKGEGACFGSKRSPVRLPGRPDQTAMSEFSSSAHLDSTAIKQTPRIRHPPQRADAPCESSFGGLRRPREAVGLSSRSPAVRGPDHRLSGMDAGERSPPQDPRVVRLFPPGGAPAVLAPGSCERAGRGPIRFQRETARGILIGADVWFGAGVRVVNGVSIGTARSSGRVQLSRARFPVRSSRLEYLRPCSD